MKGQERITRITLGSVYINDLPVRPGSDFLSGLIDIGDTVPGKELPWNKMKNGSLIAADIFLRDIPFTVIEQSMLDRGHHVSIDGESYICRLLRAGADESVENEWDDALRIYGDDDSTWHALSCYFWGQETPDAYPGERVIRGFQDAGYWGSASPDQKVGVGWRPILIPAVTKHINDSLISQFVTVHGPDGDISGIVSGFSDYDLLLERNESSAASNSAWYVAIGNKIAIDRSSIDYIS